VVLLLVLLVGVKRGRRRFGLVERRPGGCGRRGRGVFCVCCLGEMSEMCEREEGREGDRWMVSARAEEMQYGRRRVHRWESGEKEARVGRGNDEAWCSKAQRADKQTGNHKQIFGGAWSGGRGGRVGAGGKIELIQAQDKQREGAFGKGTTSFRLVSPTRLRIPPCCQAKCHRLPGQPGQGAYEEGGWEGVRVPNTDGPPHSKVDRAFACHTHTHTGTHLEEAGRRREMP